ncbi:hypothetical protein TVAG_095840 [Trichomonas vaginalis G3]|uniref:Importin N-terminal domain-containing protein n=2 Tax=Trichomonas vaginalis (strain ATCC PRA-98 / G3) TaxID=412133 RepID=A2G3V6_TRIV3|nr:hypothetical protein TVAG_095840 [Trichomonas vaginalis G3]|eukprot:XP_001301091.1 hypothetical protein [Trichomonas vaginalis G3]
MDFVQAISILGDQSNPNLPEADRFLTEAKTQQPELFLNKLCEIILNPDLPIRIRKNTIKMSTSVARIKIEDGKIESVSISGISPESIQNFISALESQFSSTDDSNEGIEYGSSLAVTLAHFRIAQYYLSPSRTGIQYPALDFLPLISTDSTIMAVQNALISIDSIIDCLPVNSPSAAELIVSTILLYINQNQNNLTLEHLFINIAGKLIKPLWSAMAKNSEFGLAFIGHLLGVEEADPVDFFWFVAQIPQYCYQMLGLAFDCPPETFSYVENYFSNQERQIDPKILIFIMQFWLYVCEDETRIETPFKLVENNLQKIIDLGLFIIQNDPTTTSYTQGDYSPVIAAMDTLISVIECYFNLCVSYLVEIISENANSENKSSKFTAAFLLHEVIKNSKKEVDPAIVELYSETISTFLEDDSIRIKCMAVKAFSQAVSSGFVEIDSDQLSGIFEFCTSTDSVMVHSALHCVSVIGTSVPQVIGPILEFLLQFIQNTENQAYQNKAFDIMIDLKSKMDIQTVCELFNLLFDFANQLKDNQSTMIDKIMSVLNSLFATIITTEKQFTDEIYDKLYNLANEIIESQQESKSSIEIIGNLGYYYGNQNSELLVHALNVCATFMLNKEFPTEMETAIKSACVLMTKVDSLDVLAQFSNFGAQILSDNEVSPDCYSFTASLISIIGGISIEPLSIVAESIVLSLQRIFDIHIKYIDSIKPIYEAVITMSYVCKDMPELLQIILDLGKVSIQLIGAEINFPKRLREVGVGLCHMIYRNAPEMWNEVRQLQCCDFIRVGGSKIKDDFVQKRMEELFS